MKGMGLQRHLSEFGGFASSDLIDHGELLDNLSNGPSSAVIYSGDTSNLSDIFERINVQIVRGTMERYTCLVGQSKKV